jgi:hypothetical protein
MAHRHDVHARGIEAGLLQGRHDPRPIGRPHCPGLLVQPLADSGLDKDAATRCLDQEAVERLQEPVLGVDLLAGPAIPEEPWDRTKEGSCIRPEGPGLDERNAEPATQIAPPIDRLVQRRGSGSFAGRPFEKSR